MKIRRRLAVLALSLIVLVTGIATWATAEDSIELPSYGITAPIPQGWRRHREDDAVLAMRWIRMDDAGVKILGLIDLKLLPRSTAENARQLVMTTAKQTGGKMLDRPVKLGQLEAYEMIGDTSPHPKRGAIVFLRAAETEYGYYVLYQALPGGGTREAYNQIAAGLQFAEPADPSRVLTARPDPVPLENVQLVMSLPDPFRRASPKEPNFRVLNFLTEKSEVELSVHPINQAVTDIHAIEKTLGGKLGTDFGWSKPPTWNHLDGSTFKVAYSDLIPAGRRASGKPVSPMQLMFVVRGDKSSLLMFMYNGPDEATSRYAEATVDIAKSVREAPEYFETRAAAAAATRAAEKSATTRTGK